ncbi:hamartin [Chelonus insularis]|uniref:hamartin n=1 Tax=Chelonus insularis TaxID=460826 RepID=UPI00158BF9BE|nr:hamartin [Chelonus insularis]
MGSNSIGPAEIFQLLESNESSDVEETKKIFHDQFSLTKDSCLVNGLFDYFLSTNSIRAIEVLSSVRDPHDKHLLDRLSETLTKPSSNNQRVQALTVLGHIARRQPTWIYKLTNHPLFKELLKLLKQESDALSIISALLLLIILIPMLPAAIGPYLNEIFDIFIHLASSYHIQSNNVFTNHSNLSGKDQFYLLHLQLGLYHLFQRLWPMYPCSLFSYLQTKYSAKDNDATYKYIIKPMLDSVRMHPSLITASKDTETNAARWKKMEHHDVVAECESFALNRSREEAYVSNNLRATPLLDRQCLSTPVNITEGLLGSVTNNDKDEDTFWSPSMSIPPQSPKTLQTSHEPRSTPSTPNNNSRSNSSPPEAAIEATPETTPVKELRQASRHTPISSAVRALGSFGNGVLSNNSRPSTPISNNINASAFVAITNTESRIFSQKMDRIFADRHSIVQAHAISLECVDKVGDQNTNQNGKNDSWNEDQEVSEIVSSHKIRINNTERLEHHQECRQGSQKNLFNEFKRLNIDCNRQQSVPSTPSSLNNQKAQSSESCSDLKPSNEVCTQTTDLIPYEHLLNEVLEPKTKEQQITKINSDSRLSPTLMLDRYIEACARVSSNDSSEKKMKFKKKGPDEDDNDNLTEEGLSELECINQHLQLMQMQLFFERQRREVHAERNRRLLGKLRNSRALEEQNNALTDRLRMTESEVIALKNEIEQNNQESKILEEKSKETIELWQTKYREEQQAHRILKEQVKLLEIELNKEKKKVSECEKQTREAEAALFDAGHQLKDALKAAKHGERLKKTLENIQKKYLLLGETQIKCLHRLSSPVSMSRQESAYIQKAYAEEVVNLQRQLDSRKATIDGLRTRLVELEKRETDMESQLLDQQRLLLEAQERNDAELRAVESKYNTQVSINLHLENRILELHGKLEAANSKLGLNTANLTYSESPNERSPPLSSSLASSSGRNLSFQSNTGIMNDYNDSAGEISNLQAIVEPSVSTFSQSTTPVRRK